MNNSFDTDRSISGVKDGLHLFRKFVIPRVIPHFDNLEAAAVPNKIIKMSSEVNPVGIKVELGCFFA